MDAFILCLYPADTQAVMAVRLQEGYGGLFLILKHIRLAAPPFLRVIAKSGVDLGMWDHSTAFIQAQNDPSFRQDFRHIYGSEARAK